LLVRLRSCSLLYSLRLFFLPSRLLTRLEYYFLFRFSPQYLPHSCAHHTTPLSSHNISLLMHKQLHRADPRDIGMHQLWFSLRPCAPRSGKAENLTQKNRPGGIIEESDRDPSRNSSRTTLCGAFRGASRPRSLRQTRHRGYPQPPHYIAYFWAWLLEPAYWCCREPLVLTFIELRGVGTQRRFQVARLTHVGPGRVKSTISWNMVLGSLSKAVFLSRATRSGGHNLVATPTSRASDVRHVPRLRNECSRLYRVVEACGGRTMFSGTVYGVELSVDPSCAMESHRLACHLMSRSYERFSGRLSSGYRSSAAGVENFYGTQT